jgi:phosphoglycolate phosphatase-like HAD superfamily hydrolase
MRYEEKLIDGVLHYSDSPRGAWYPCTVQEVSRRYASLKEETVRRDALAADLFRDVLSALRARGIEQGVCTRIERYMRNRSEFSTNTTKDIWG